MIATPLARGTELGGSAAAGWYGKLPSLGDFASRRLDPGFVEAWDLWLAEGMAAWRAREPDGWLARYLASPSWRFVLAPGSLPAALGTGCWVGVLMPSVDRVGRYFPLTLALHLPALPAAGALLPWLQGLNDVALDALDEDWSAERLESELQRLGGPDPDPVAAWPAAADPLAGLQAGQSCWMHGDALGALHARHGTGLPQGTDFDALLGASPA
jgi:type VI secretion system protein ImpM